MTDELPPPKDGELRSRAEQALAQGHVEIGGAQSDLRLHELQVYQVELEMQNDALRQAQAETADALQRLAELNTRLEELVALRTAELVAARDAAEAANRAKSSFLSNMSHELRTPLGGVTGMIDLALELAVDPKQADWLRRAKTSGEHLLSIINDVLDISKIEAGGLTIQPVDFSLASVIDSVTTVLSPTIDLKGLSFSVDVPPDLAQRAFHGDCLRIKQVLLNLLGNAAKFTAAGEVTLGVRALKDTASGVLLRFEVRDTGIGIAPQDRARLFSPFVQADISTTRKFGGTGLGLVISARLVQMMGGSIDVESVPGSGSRFWFTVPVGAAELSQAVQRTTDLRSAMDRLKAEFAGSRILLAEDDVTNQIIARVWLENAGLEVDVACDGEAAVAMARATPYDLILMDMQMPVMDGVTATLAIRALPGGADKPILAMTANVFGEARAQCLSAGMNDFIIKPVNVTALQSTLLKWLEWGRSDHLGGAVVGKPD